MWITANLLRIEKILLLMYWIVFGMTIAIKPLNMVRSAYALNLYSVTVVLMYFDISWHFRMDHCSEILQTVELGKMHTEAQVSIGHGLDGAFLNLKGVRMAHYVLCVCCGSWSWYCRLVDLENSLLGLPVVYRSFLLELRKAQGAEAEAVYGFGHLLYEMIAGKPLKSATMESHPPHASRSAGTLQKCCCPDFF